MSPKRITQLGLILGGISIVGAIMMIIIQPGWGLLSWWPVPGVGLSMLLFAASLLKGAYITAQKRAEMVDLLNDCYSGNGQGQGNFFK